MRIKSNMIYRIKWGCLALLFLVAFPSCEKFLNQDPKYLLTPDGAVTNEASAQSVLNGAYSFIGKDEYTVRFTAGFSSMLGAVNASTAAFNFNMSATGDNRNLWEVFYKTVNAANAAIAAIETLPESAFNNPARQKQMLGEAHTIRAFAHFYAFLYFGRWWDEASNPYGLIYRTEISTLKNVYQERLSVGESYDMLFKDLDYGIANAPDYTTGVRVSKQLAQALKAKLLLYRGKGSDYQDALPLVQDILAKATGLGLVLEPSLTQLYQNSWDSKELLFGRYRESTDDVVSAYNYTYGYNYATLAATDFVKGFLEGDPRYEEAWGNVKAPVANSNTVTWAPKKLARKGRQEGGDNDKYTTYFLRLTELYFMEAELLEKTGAPLSQAMNNINLIRGRSELDPLTASSQSEFYTILFSELFKELHLENEADWMASLRVKDASGNRLIVSLRPTVTLDENRFIYPIPSSETNYNNLIKQNPGYENLTN